MAEEVPRWVLGLIHPLHASNGTSGTLKRFKCPLGPDHEFVDSPARVARRGPDAACPKCALRRQSVAANFALVAQQWSPNNPAYVPSPSECAATSSAAVWFRCEAGHEFREVVAKRCSAGDAGCPECNGSRMGWNNTLASRVRGIRRLWDGEANAVASAREVSAANEGVLVHLVDALTGFKWRCTPAELTRVALEAQTAGIRATDAIIEKFVPVSLRSRCNGVIAAATSRALDEALDREIEYALSLALAPPLPPAPPPKKSQTLMWGRPPPPPAPKKRRARAPPPPATVAAGVPATKSNAPKAKPAHDQPKARSTACAVS
ncbi:hypothetical protein M885DRAFT_530820 [Pelagophyceae sp. CCMP2097]|nr:hypothetical protein M885DRAFT_530820 [Pelagophyceae sp. CCMP2097]